MPAFVDIHAHVLPGIDDGPETLEQAVEMVRVAAAQGTRLQAATPHLHRNFPEVDPGEIADRLQAVRDAVADVEIELISGGEVSTGWAIDATADQMRLVSYGQRGSDILIETPSRGTLDIHVVLEHVRRQGYRVTLAHPERSIAGESDLKRVAGLAAAGVLVQVNAESLIAPHRELRRSARRLCTDGTASVLASDGHRGTGRRPVSVLADGFGELRRLVGDDRAEWMVTVVPRAVLAGGSLAPGPPVQPRRRWFRGRRPGA